MVSSREFLAIPDSTVRLVRFWSVFGPIFSARFTSRDSFSILVAGNPIDINIDVQLYQDPYGQPDSSADINNLSQTLSQGLTIGGQWPIDRCRYTKTSFKNPFFLCASNHDRIDRSIFMDDFKWSCATISLLWNDLDLLQCALFAFQLYEFIDGPVHYIICFIKPCKK